MSAVVVAKNKPKWYAHSAIVFAWMFLFGLLPAPAPITHLGMQVLGIFIGMLWGWVFVDMVWPSILGMIALGLTDYTTILESFSTGIGHRITLQVIVALLFGAYLSQYKLDETMAFWFVSRKIAIGRPWIFAMLIFVAAYIIGALISSFPAIILIWGIFYKFCDAMGIKRRSSYAAYVLIGIAHLGTLGGLALPFKESAIFYKGIIEPAAGVELGFMKWIIFWNVCYILCIFIYLFIGKVIIRPDVSAFNKDTDFYAEYRNIRFTKEQYVPLAILIIFVVLLTLPSFLPEGWVLRAQLNNMGIVGVGLCCIIALSVLCNPDGKPLTDFGELFRLGINWQLIWLVAATMPIAAAMESENTGILAWTTMKLMPLAQNLNSIAFIIVVTTVFAAITQVAHNMVLMIVFIPMFCKLCAVNGTNPVVFALVFTMGIGCALITPGGSANAALFHGNTEWITTKQAYTYSIWVVIFTVLMTYIVGLPLAAWLYPMP